MKFVSLSVLLLSLPCARALSIGQYRGKSVADVSLARCMTDPDPDSCAGGVDQMLETASTIKKEVQEELNATRTRLNIIVSDFLGCNTLVSQVTSYTSSFKKQAESHLKCRQKQEVASTASRMCKDFLSAVEANRTLLCKRQSLTQSPNDLVPLCTPTLGEPVGMWLEDMMETFSTRHIQWKKDHEACQKAEEVVRPQVLKCDGLQRDLNLREKRCGSKLDSLESFSCSWATGFATRCSSYDTCYASVLTRHSDTVREANASVVRWRKSWLAAARMECMAKAIGPSGSVDQDKMHACNAANITNMSFIKIVVEQPPSKAVCPTPKIYPGSTSYNEEVYGKLPSGLTVRDPTSCPWSPNSACSAVDLNKLHFDQPRPGSTSIEVSGETLTIKASGNFNFWTRSRAGAPVAWLDAPTDDTYTFEVDCRLVSRGNKLIAFVSVYDGPDGAKIPFTFGPRTWARNGVGIENVGARFYAHVANPGFGEDPFVWHRLRVVRRPGVVFDVAYRRLDGSDWVQVRSGMKPAHIQSEGMRIALGLKQGNSNGEIEFRNLVVYGGEPKSCPYRRDAPISVCSAVDLNKLHIDQPEPGRTDIKVSGETLTMKGSGNLDLWTHGRRGAPVAWLDAPTDDTYTFEVDCRLVLGGGTLISVVSVYDGPDGAYNFPFTFGPRTWSGNGVGIQNMGLQDYVRGPANEGFGEDPFVWHRLRVVRRPGVVFDTAYRRLDGSDWVQVRSGMMPSHFKAKGTRIALGLKQGGSNGEIEFRNLVVYGGEPRNC